MSDTKEKDFDSASVASVPKGGKVEFYDPSKESIWTRLGLTPESFKRAPGTTGYVASLNVPCALLTFLLVVRSLPVPPMSRISNVSSRIRPCSSRR